MKKLCLLLVAAAFGLIVATGCANEAPASDASSAGQFDALVSAGDEALEAGDAKAAFDLYTEALDSPDADDANGSVAEKQSHAKALYLARNLLAKEASPTDPKDSVAILVEYQAAATETVAAKLRVIEFLEGQANSMRQDIPKLKATIEAEDEFKVPLSIRMVGQMTDHWTKTLGRIPGDFGVKTLDAMALLARSSDEANMVMERQWVQECVADLERSEATLTELDSLLAAMRSDL